MGTVRIEMDASVNLSDVAYWIRQHRGEVVELDRTTRLALGAPISGARAMVVAILLQDDLHPGPQLGGVLRALSNRTDAEPARLVFEGRSPLGLPSDEAHRVASSMLDAISEHIAAEGAVANVA